jgi:hypothetical protein
VRGGNRNSKIGGTEQRNRTLEASLYTLLQIFSVTLFEKMPMPQALSETECTFEDHEIDNQLKLFSF